MNKQTVTPLPATSPRYSLLGVATQITTDDRWQAGVQWTPEQMGGGGAGVIGIDCGDNETMDPDLNPALAMADPFGVWTEDHCSTFGFAARDYEGRARRSMEAMQSALIAKELQSGALAQANSLDNHWLTEAPDVVTGAAAAPTLALATLEQGLADWMWGARRAMIHASPFMLTHLHAANAITLNGQQWQTAMGNVVVSDAGYDGIKPDGSGSVNDWLYATPWIYYRLGAIDIIPGSLDQARMQATDRATNLTVLRTIRPVLLQWDSSFVPAVDTVGVLAAETNIARYGGL